MKNIVTNLRIPENDWFRVKAEAANLGVSVNTYMKQLIDAATIQQMIPDRRTGKKSKKSHYQPLWDIIEKISKIPNKPMDASEDDKIIYGID